MKRIEQIDRATAAWKVLNDADKQRFLDFANAYTEGRKSLTEPKPAAERRPVGRPKRSAMPTPPAESGPRNAALEMDGPKQ